jgi:hypothetical protein
MHENDLFCISFLDGGTLQPIQEYIVKFKDLFFHCFNLTRAFVRLCVGGVLWCHAELVKVLSKAWNGPQPSAWSTQQVCPWLYLYSDLI